MLDEIAPLVEAGFALHWLHPREKRPIGNDWSLRPRATLASLKATHAKGNNVGLRLGEPSRVGDFYVYVLDLDIRVEKDAQEAYEALKKILPEFELVPTVKSGSGGLSRHFYILCDRLFRGAKLARSSKQFTDAKGKKHRHWEIELFGTGKQVAIPPSIHPDTGKAYTWIRPFDFDELDFGLGPIVNAARVESWNIKVDEDDESDDDDDDLFALIAKMPLDDIDLDKAREILFKLPLDKWCEDRDGWVQTGMATHHQFEGSEEGFALWCEFSKQSKKFNLRDSKAVWKSFKSDKKGGVTFKTLIDAVSESLEDDIEDLIGGGSEDKDEHDEWRVRLDKSDEGAYRSTLPNIEMILRNDARTKGVIGVNIFTQEVVQIAKPGVQKRGKVKERHASRVQQLNQEFWKIERPRDGDLWTDQQDLAVRSIIEGPRRYHGYGIKVSDRDLHGAIKLVAHDNAFHPVRTYLGSLEWDGVPRVDNLFVRFLGVPATEYTQEIARLMMVAAVTRVFEPGHKFDYAVIIEGAQGAGKSTFIETLGKGWFCELQGDFHDEKKMVEGMQGSWIMEIPELSQFNRSDVEAIKAFITRKVDKVRLAFERRAAEFPRQCIFIGSTNNTEYLRDDTGGRRFWPVECCVPFINTNALRAEVDQYWAEAYQIYLRMRQDTPKPYSLPLTLSSKEAKTIAAELQESRRTIGEADVMVGQIQHWVETPQIEGNGFDDEKPQLLDKICGLQIWVECLGERPGEFLKHGNHYKVNKALRKLRGWMQADNPLRFGKYGRQRGFVRSEE